MGGYFPLKHMKRLYISGASGFVGQTLTGMAEEVARLHGWQLVQPEARVELRDAAGLRAALAALNPDGVIHLAGQSFVPAAIKDPEHTLQVNLIGTLHLLQALAASGFRGPLLYVSSGDVYGPVTPGMLPLGERQAVNPANPYALSKAATELLVRQWASSGAPWRSLIARPFNHIGPGQRADFVVASLARQINLIRLGRQAPRIRLGDIQVTRDFTDVRDLARAYLALLEHGENAQLYNVCSGQERSIASVLDDMLQLAGLSGQVAIECDAARLRAADQRRVYGDPGRIHAATGWQPQIPWQQTLQDVLDDWRRRCLLEGG